VKLPRLASSDQPAALIDCDALIVGVTPGAEDTLLVVGDVLGEAHAHWLQQAAAALGNSGSSDDCTVLPAPEGVLATTVVVVGLGRDEFTPATLRHAAGSATRQASSSEHIAVALPAFDSAAAQAVVEGALLGGYQFTANKKPSQEPTWSTLTIVGARDEGALQAGVVVAESVWWVRDLVNTPPNELYPESFQAQVTDTLKDLPIDIEVFDEDQLVEGGFGGIVGVGGGSTRPPRLVALRYRPEDATGHIALVGKGITFDSGGLSLKPAASMLGMKYDMTGAATVSGVMRAVASLKAPVAVTAWLCLAENMPSGSAQRPGDVISIRGGTTVEVLNTDAEGRLVLADGLQAASEEHPDLIIDVATLTGAARIALGERYAGLMGDAPATALVEKAAQSSGELVWTMPLPEELRKGLNSDVADIANVATGSSLGGMLVAGLFLQEFVGPRATQPGDDTEASRIPWAHLDIAGPASNTLGAYGYTPKGPTGATTRALISLLMGIDQDGIGTLSR
jgi:leucyl aminopeptidase